jgi:protein associated with RNAse G/E
MTKTTVFPSPLDALFFPEKCDLNSTCVLRAEGTYYFQTYKYPYPHRVKTTMMILVAATTIFWVSMMNKLHYGC